MKGTAASKRIHHRMGVHDVTGARAGSSICAACTWWQRGQVIFPSISVRRNNKASQQPIHPNKQQLQPGGWAQPSSAFECIFCLQRNGRVSCKARTTSELCSSMQEQSAHACLCACWRVPLHATRRHPMPAGRDLRPGNAQTPAPGNAAHTDMHAARQHAPQLRLAGNQCGAGAAADCVSRLTIALTHHDTSAHHTHQVACTWPPLHTRVQRCI